MNSLALRIADLARPQLGPDGHAERIPYLDFVVDGKSLGQLFGADVTALTVEDPTFRHENLRRLSGEAVPLPTFRPKFHRTRVERLLHLRGVPFAFHESAFDDARVGLYYCPCGDMDCGVLSTRLEFTTQEVIWHDVG